MSPHLPLNLQQASHILLIQIITYLLLENQKLSKWIPGHCRQKLTNTDRMLLSKLAHPLGPLRKYFVSIVHPKTIEKWFRRFVLKKQNPPSDKNNYVGRPGIPNKIRKLVISIARENTSWGYEKIAGVLANLGFSISHQSIGNILSNANIPPSPERKLSSSWHRFLKTHKHVWATDFFTKEVWELSGLKTYYILFFIHIKSRKIFIAGATEFPKEAWMLQHARNISSRDEFLDNIGFLIHDRDSKYSHAFGKVFSDIGFDTIRLPKRSPNLNAFAERFVLSIKSECLDHLLLLGECSLIRALREYEAFYNTERNHQGIDNVIPFPKDHVGQNCGEIKKSFRLGGLLNYYYRQAA
ncbi:MAG: integrase core domain-containing protein [Verrucomicrobiota bacterium]